MGRGRREAVLRETPAPCPGSRRTSWSTSRAT